MKYAINKIITINNRDWRVAEYRMSHGREWKYTLSYEHTDGMFDVIQLNEDALDKIVKTHSQHGG